MGYKLVDDKYKEALRSELNNLEEIRENIINTSVKVTKLSKMLIYSIIREDNNRVEDLLKELESRVKDLRLLIDKHPMFRNNGIIGIQEYVEAKILYEYIKNNKIPTHNELGVDIITYLYGLADFIGEIYRKSIEEMIKNNIDFALNVRNTIEEVMFLFLHLEPRNYDIRRKLDYISNILNNLNEKIFYKTLRS